MSSTVNQRLSTIEAVSGVSQNTDGSVAIGGRSNASGNGATSMGQDSKAQGSGATAIGGRSNASGNGATSMGQDSKAQGSGATAIGQGASAQGGQATSVGQGASAGSSGTAIGSGANAQAPGATALGQGAEAGTSGTAIGNGATAQAPNSVALGANSVADRPDSVSVGSVGNERTLTNVANGTRPTDAVNKQQLDQVGRNASRGIAAATALSMVPDVDIGKKGMVGVGVANFGGQTALALGAKARITESVKASIGVGVAGSKVTVGVGAGFQW
ncbi:YadA family autotransporter adhesin [Comamonas sp. C24C]